MLSALRQLTSVVLYASAVITISASILPASGASVAVLPDPFLSSLLVLHARQTGTIPAACVSTCGTAPQTFTQSCTPNFSASGCCVESFEMDLFNCYECIGSTQNIMDYSVPQQTLDQIIMACAAVGSPIQKLTLPGQDPNRALATSAGASRSGPSTARSGSQTQSQSQSSSTQSQSQSQSQSISTATSPPTSLSTPRSPVTETSNGSGAAGGSQTSSGTSAGSAQTSNAGMSLSVGVGVGADAMALGMGSVIGMVVATVLTVIAL